VTTENVLKGLAISAAATLLALFTFGAVREGFTAAGRRR
jgi:hypothetical protein